MDSLKRIGQWILYVIQQAGSRLYPERASTQTWMFLTFALFVGMAVVGVGIYASIYLKSEIDEATSQSLREQAVNMANAIAEANSYEEALAVAELTSKQLNMRVAVKRADTTYLVSSEHEWIRDATILEEPRVHQRRRGNVLYSEYRQASGGVVLFYELSNEETGFTIQLGMAEPLLYELVNQLQFTLLIGLMAALLLSLFGSWVAARRVTRPLRSIMQSTRKITQNKMGEEIFVDSRASEFQDMAKSLNKMSALYRNKIEELERLARIQSEFIGNVSHEVRNPIFAVSGYLEALSTPVLPPEQQQRYAQKGLVNLERLNNLFADLIEIARLEYREDMIKLALFDMQELAREVYDTLNPKAEAKGLILQMDNPSMEVFADRNRIRQVIMNLIENAIVYTDEGSVRLRMYKRQEKVRIEVVDTGKGISEDHLDRIFERFYRVDPDRSRKSGGTGLGLSIVKQILQAHGEQISVESTPGRGTRFWFNLPVSEALNAESESV